MGVGDLSCKLPFDEQGVMSCVAASPNDPIFISHHANVDRIFEKWITKNMDALYYPLCEKVREGHRKRDYIVPFIPLYTHMDMFNTSDNFGYICSAFSTQAYALLVFSLALAILLL